MSESRDLESELGRALKRRRGPHGEPREGLYTLTREMTADEEDQFDVDMSILDFLAFRAADLVLQWRSSSNPYQSDLPIALVTMTSEWRTVLKHKYGGRRLNSQTAFRSRLLQFVLLFTHRLNHDETWTTEASLNDIRTQNRNRGVYWKEETSHSPALRHTFDTASQFPLSDGTLAENRHELASALDMPQDRRRWVTDVEGTPSLSCLLPLFIELTAARVTLGDFVPTEDWLHLAAQFMLQAVIEEYIRNGAFGPETFNTIFAFGCPQRDLTGHEGSDVIAMQKLFCDPMDPHEQIHGWAKIKRQYINELLPQNPNTTTVQAMEAAQERFSYQNFESDMIAFLKTLHDGLVRPDLVQVEEGRINIHGNELPEADSREMIERMGLR